MRSADAKVRHASDPDDLSIREAVVRWILSPIFLIQRVEFAFEPIASCTIREHAIQSRSHSIGCGCAYIK